MATQKNAVLNAVSFQAGGTIGQFEPVKLTTASGANKVVVVPTASTDRVVGVAQIDATSGQAVSVTPISAGAIVKMRVGSGGVTAGDLVGLDGTDYTEIATLTLSGSGTTLRQVLGEALQTGVSNDYVEVLLRDPVVTI